MTLRKEAAIGPAIVALCVATVFGGLYFSVASSKHWLIAVGGVSEIAGVLMIASPELGEALKTARERIELLTLRGLVLVVWFRIRLMTKDPAARSAAFAIWLIALLVAKGRTALADRAASEVEADIAPTEQREWSKWVRDAIAESARENDDRTRRLVNRHLPLRLSGVSLVIVGLIAGTIGHL